MQGVLYPNGEFTVSTLAQKKFKPSYPVGKAPKEYEAWRTLVVAHLEMFGLQETLRNCSSSEEEEEVRRVFDVLDRWVQESGSLGFANDPNSRQTWLRPLRGQRGITSYARRLVRNGAFAIESMHHKSTVSFLTLTLPPMDGKSFKTFMKEYWSSCTKKFFDWLSKRLQRANLPKRWCGVTEIQEKRYAETGIPYPHLHVVFVGRHSSGGWELSPMDFNRAWRRILMATGLPVFAIGKCDFRAVHNVQRVQKSVEAYLGKYMSKGVSVDCKGQLGDWEGYLPRNWHFVSGDLKTWIKKNTKSGEKLGAFLCALSESNDTEWLKWVFPIKIQWGDVELQCGFAGKLNRSRLAWVKDHDWRKPA